MVLDDTALYKAFGQAIDDSDWVYALEVARQIVKEHPRHPLAHYCLGVAHECLEEWSDAILAYRDVERIDAEIWDKKNRATLPQSALFALETECAVIGAIHNIVPCYDRMGLRESAIAAYRRILEHDSENWPAKEALSRLLKDPNQLEFELN